MPNMRPITIALSLIVTSLILTHPSETRSQQVVPVIERSTKFVCAVPPPPPAGWPGGVAQLIQSYQQGCGRPEITGYYFKVTFTDASGNPPAGTELLQRLQKDIHVFVTNAQSTMCGDIEVNSGSYDVEYFPAYPADDYQAAFGCCEQKGDITVTAQVAFLPRPANTQPVQQGGVAGAAWQTEDQRESTAQQVFGSRTLNWGYRFQFDGCNFREACGGAQCMDVWTQSQIPAGNPNDRSWAPVDLRRN